MCLKKIIFIIISFSAVLAGVLYYNRLDPREVFDYRIAIFQPAIHPSMEEISRGFKEVISLKTSKKIVFDEYNATGNSTQLRAQAEEIVKENYDLVFTIGAQTSQMVFHAAQKKGALAPHVFAAVDDPLAMGIVKSMDRSGTHVTGVLATRLYQEQIDALLRIKPTIKRVLLVYNPAQGTGLEKDRDEVEKLLHARGVTLKTVEVSHHNEIAEKVPAFLPDTDVVFVLMDNTVVSGVSSLVTLCNRYGVLLCASDHGSGLKGAALTFGADDYQYGAYSANLALKILKEKQDPSSIPLTRMLNQRMVINTKTMEKQGLKLSSDELKKIADGE